MKKFLTLLALFMATNLMAAPVSEEQRTHIDLRRTTLVVSDIEQSLAFYRDALGMTLIYDNIINTPRDASLEDADKSLRLVFLQANDNFVGILGLLQYIKPKKEAIDLTDSSFKEGTIVLVFNTQKLESGFEKASRIDGVKVLSEPGLVSYPSYDGSSTISVMVSVLQDPDGFTVELNQLQEDIH